MKVVTYGTITMDSCEEAVSEVVIIKQFSNIFATVLTSLL